MTVLRTRPRSLPSWTEGLIQDVEAENLRLGTIREGTNFVPEPGGRLAVRGGSRIVLTLNDDAGTPAEITQVTSLFPFHSPASSPAVGAIATGWSDGQNKVYLWRLSQDMAFATGTEATSRADLTTMTAATWANTASPPRPNHAELFEKIFTVDATETYANRNSFFSVNAAGTLTEPTFAFGAGAAQVIRPFCCAEYNNVLFVAGYGSEDAGDADRPELVRHSLLGDAPDAATGFDDDAWAMLGAKGRRVYSMTSGRGILLCAKEDVLFRIHGFGRAYPGWQYAIDEVTDSLGHGVLNANSLVFVEERPGVKTGFWYGIGTKGPWRSDGYNVESLEGPRQRGWRAIDQLATSWVAHHPDRRIVLFGLHPLESRTGRSATYPWIIWLWDIDRNVWQSDWDPNTDFFFGTTVATTTGAGPSAPPSAPSSSAETATGFDPSWTNGDATAETEFWHKEGASGTYVLAATRDAGDTTFTYSAVAHTSHFWKVRHRKNGLYSAFAAEVESKTLLAVPSLVAYGRLDPTQKVAVQTTQNNPNTTDIRIERSLKGLGSWSELVTVSRFPGTKIYYDSGADCTKEYDYRARSEDSAWPVTTSAFSTTDDADPCVDEAPP